ncbi:MAG: polyketide synthase [Myxococcota bacterium]
MTVSTSQISLHVDEAGIALLHLRDEERQNALGTAFVEQLTEALHTLAEHPTVKVCLVRGTSKVFCSGGDRELLIKLAEGEIVASDIMLSRAMLEVPIPMIAVMEGHAVGGGLTLGLCCDLVMMARESRYGCTFMNMGFTPGMGTTRLLSLAVGEYIAAEMMLGGKFYRGKDFEGKALFNTILPKAELWDTAQDMAARIAEKPRYALELLKRDLSLKKRALFETARTSEVAMHQVCFSRPELAEMIRERFVSE